MKRILWIVPLLCAACSSSPTSPSRLDTAPLSAQRQLDPTRSTFTFGPALGAASVTNTTETADTFTFIVWDASDTVNQRDVAHQTATVAAGATFVFGVGLTVDPCATYQPDIYKGLPLADRYTMSDVGNYLFAGGPLAPPRQHCRHPPDPPKDCVDCGPTTTCIGCGPVCSADALDYLEGHVDGDRIVETVRVKAGRGGFVWYLVSWGVPAFRVGVDVPTPQAQVHLTTQTLHDGLNVLTAPLAGRAFAGWQWEGGCVKPPPELREADLYMFRYLDSGWGNFEVTH